MPVISVDDAPVFEAGHATITGLASPSRGATDTAAWRVRLAPDQPSPVHSLDREELFVVIEGAVTAEFSAGHAETARAGGVLIVPAGTEFSLVARGAAAEAVCVLPIGGRGRIGDGEPFTPPWAE